MHCLKYIGHAIALALICPVVQGHCIGIYASFPPYKDDECINLEILSLTHILRNT